MEQLENLCVSYIEPILTVSCDLSLVEAINKLNKISHLMDIPYPQIIASTEYDTNKSRIMFTGHKDWVFLLNKKLESSDFKKVGQAQIGLFISGFGLSSSTYEQTIFEKIQSTDLKILKYMRDAKGLLFVYAESEKIKAQEFADTLI
jgi:hypothetical protein